MSTSAGSIVGDGTSDVVYFGAADYGDYGSCGASSWRWIHALCSDAGTEDDKNNSTKPNEDSGSTWASGSGAARYMVIDLGVERHFNELRVFQMWDSDGKVTSVRMYSHPNTTILPTRSDGGWVSIFNETTVSAGAISGNTVSSPTTITFSYTDSRFVMIEAKNDGTHGNASWTEIRELKLFDTNIALPVELEYFKVETINKNQVQIDWQTATEINNDFFTIERSDNAKNWSGIKILDGAGNSVEDISYQIIDYAPMNGISYYRLKQTDFDGQFSYSAIKSVHIEQRADIVVFPNPAETFITIQNIHSIENLALFNIIGTEIKYNAISAGHDVRIDVRHLESGIYFIKSNDSVIKFYKE